MRMIRNKCNETNVTKSIRITTYINLETLGEPLETQGEPLETQGEPLEKMGERWENHWKRWEGHWSHRVLNGSLMGL
jgi:hypothetical protein